MVTLLQRKCKELKNSEKYEQIGIVKCLHLSALNRFTSWPTEKKKKKAALLGKVHLILK